MIPETTARDPGDKCTVRLTKEGRQRDNTIALIAACERVTASAWWPCMRRDHAHAIVPCFELNQLNTRKPSAGGEFYAYRSGTIFPLSFSPSFGIAKSFSLWSIVTNRACLALRQVARTCIHCQCWKLRRPTSTLPMFLLFPSFLSSFSIMVCFSPI